MIIKCSKCKTEKDSNEFTKNKSTTTGFFCYCKVCSKEYQNKRYNDKRPEILEWYKKYRNGPYKFKHRELSRNSHVKAKARVISNYSQGKNVCVCCGEPETLFLTIDHINGDGREHRDKVGMGSNMYYWLIKNNYPDGFQVLCFNCNCGRSVNKGICPHEKRNVLR